jgi:hypothetical protein
VPETLEEVHSCMLLRGVRTRSALAGLLMPAMSCMLRLTAWRSPTPRLSPNRAGPWRMPRAICHVRVCGRPAGPESCRCDLFRKDSSTAGHPNPGTRLATAWHHPGIFLHPPQWYTGLLATWRRLGRSRHAAGRREDTSTSLSCHHICKGAVGWQSAGSRGR